MPKPISSLPIKKVIWGFIGILFAGTCIWAVQWATYTRPPLPEALEALESDALVAVTQDHDTHGYFSLSG